MNAPRRHPLTLRFADRDLETAFQRDYFVKSLRQARLGILIGIFVYGPLFGAMDWIARPEAISVFWPIRVSVCLVGAIVYAFSYTRIFPRYMQMALSALVVTAGGGLIAISVADVTPRTYFDGLALLTIGGYVAIRLRFAWAAGTGCLLALTYAIALYGSADLPFGLYLRRVNFLIATNLIGMFAGYVLESYARTAFYQARLIDRKRTENERLLEAKSRFFTNVSHELRTPLTLILAPLEELLQKTQDATIHRPLTVLQRNARRLRRLIDELLDVSRLEAGRMSLQAERNDLATFLRNIVASFSSRAEQQHITLSLEAEHEPVHVCFDPEKLDKVFVNLIGNALKFTPEGGTVQISITRPDTDHVAVAVRDSGPGIPAEEQPHVFERFRQGTRGAGRETSSGIGLALTKQLVELHHGTIELESEEGFGSTFTVILPTRTEQIEGAKQEDAAPASFEKRPLPSVETQPTSPTETDAASSEETATVLVVEDHQDMRSYLQDRLLPDYDVLLAENGEEGLEKTRRHMPDLVISDVMMPEMDGFDLCEAIKNDTATSHIPVVLLTAKAASNDAVEGFETGADAYVPKPFNVRELRARIASLIATRRDLRRQFSQKVVAQPRALDVPSADEAFMERARSAIEEHLDDADFGVEELASEVGMSPRQLQRKLKAITDETPSGFLRLMRLRRAAQLLEQDYGTVAEVAYAVGFNTPSYFTRRFREVFDVPPSKYDGARETD